MRFSHQSVENVVFVLLAEDICVLVALLHVGVLKWVVWFAACRLFECQGWLRICRSMSGGLWKIDWVCLVCVVLVFLAESCLGLFLEFLYLHCFALYLVRLVLHY